MTVEVVENMKLAFRDTNQVSAELLNAIYDKQVVFVDPVHRIEGLANLTNYLDKVYTNVHSCQFIYSDEMLSDGRGSLRWQMKLVHPKLKGGDEVLVNGATFIEYSDRITFHRDYYDLGEMLYEHVPLLGSAVQYIKKRMG